MKKLFYSLFTLAMTAVMFTSCESVPAPYDDPNNNPGGGGTVVVDPVGDGTQENPYNVIAAINYAKTLDVGAESERDIYIKGVVVSIAENYTTQYGNARFYISDDGTAKNQFLIYRALYLGNKKYTDGDILAEGDTVIICGKVTNYNGTLETQQNKAFLYSLNGKSEGGGGGGGATGEAKGSGTLEDPYNPAGASAAVANLTWTSNDDYQTTGEVYVKGKISRIADKGTFTDGGSYGNASFYISEDGTQNGEFYCFRILYLGNKKFESGKTDIKVGDDVIVCGQLMNYRGNTPETVAGKAYIYSLNGKSESGGGGGGATGEAKGSGTQADPYNPAGASAAVADFTWTSNDDYQTTGEVYVKGKISRIADKGTFTDGGTYGNASFYISEDGTQNGEFYCYRILYLGNKKFESGKTDIKIGDEVIVCGQLMNYRGNTPETVAGKAYLYSLNGKTEGGGDTPQGAGTYESPLTVSQAISLAEADAAWVKGYIVGYVPYGEAKLENAKFSSAIDDEKVPTNLIIAESANENNYSKCIPVQLTKGDFRDKFNLKENADVLGKQIIIAGQLTAYFGVPGLKSPTYLEANGKSVGNKAKFRKR
jgi:hypothetical protein